MGGYLVIFDTSDKNASEILKELEHILLWFNMYSDIFGSFTSIVFKELTLSMIQASYRRLIIRLFC